MKAAAAANEYQPRPVRVCIEHASDAAAPSHASAQCGASVGIRRTQMSVAWQQAASTAAGTEARPSSMDAGRREPDFSQLVKGLRLMSTPRRRPLFTMMTNKSQLRALTPRFRITYDDMLIPAATPPGQEHQDGSCRPLDGPPCPGP